MFSYTHKQTKMATVKTVGLYLRAVHIRPMSRSSTSIEWIKRESKIRKKTQYRDETIAENIDEKTFK